MTRGARPHPADLATAGILLVVVVALAAAALRGAPVGGALALHAGLLAGDVALALVLARHPAGGWAGLVRGIAVVAVMFTLYGTLGRIAFAAVPWRADALLAAMDASLLGSPVRLAARWATSARVEALSFVYAAFIPYLYLSIVLGLLGRPEGEREEFVTGFALLYAFSFLGYLLLPARGPVVELATALPPLPGGGRFHALVVHAIERMGGPHGAFPSLHLGASLFACRFDFWHGNPLRGLIYLPLVALIVVATLVLRYHYAIDLLAGAALALLAGWLAGRWWRPRPAPPVTAAASPAPAMEPA